LSRDLIERRSGLSFNRLHRVHGKFLRESKLKSFRSVEFGSLEIDGVRLKDTAGFPSVYYNEAATFSTILDLYRASRGLA